MTLVEEAGLAVIAAMDDMLWHACKIEPGLPGHGRLRRGWHGSLAGGGNHVTKEFAERREGKVHSDPAFRRDNPTPRIFLSFC
jgi:hypothetical protein